MGPVGELLGLRGGEMLFHFDEVLESGLLEQSLRGVQFFLSGEDGGGRRGITDSDGEFRAQLPNRLPEPDVGGFVGGFERIKDMMLFGSDAEVLMHPVMQG